jgi:hypothetical protein
VRGDRYEPFVHFALGPMWFRQRTRGCRVRGFLFLQAGAGVEARVFEQGFIGAAVIGTIEGRGKDCSFGGGGGSADAPSYGEQRSVGVTAFVLSFRYGPSFEEPR